ncbi:MAG: PDK repeat-containing protein [Bacteroidetes bacterium]|nr:MAG: PDK repeat-containing protein [Bacteroidota bacterium]
MNRIKFLSKKTILPGAVFLFLSTVSFAQNNAPAIRPVSNSVQNTSGVLFEENKNQWPKQVKFMADAGGGVRLFMESGRFTYVKYDQEKISENHEHEHRAEKGRKHAGDAIAAHAFRVNFQNANVFSVASGNEKQNGYRNYLIGSDASRWASNVPVFSEVRYADFYPGIDLKAYSSKGWFKYDFIVDPGADPAQLAMNYEGVEGLSIQDNRLVIPTSAGNLVEDQPYAYQEIGGRKITVPCFYNLSKDSKTVSFVFPKSYDKRFPLVIDPVLVAATYSGSPASTTTYGHCATYDIAGNIYTGGECFGVGYPTTVGAYQLNFGGGARDIAISKLDPNGSNLIWATYIGGSSDDYPNSLMTNAAGELYVLGSTSSANYPTTVGCYDNTYNGGGADIALTALNSTGTGAVGSTFVGGSADDGGGTWISFMNGHDAMRGEVFLDPSGTPWITSYTNSANFPTSGGAFDQTYNGAIDACVFRMNPNLSNLQWSTYLGGTADEMGYGIRTNSSGEAFVCGPTSSSDYPVTVGTYQGTYQGGSCDGYMARFNAAGSALIASSFFGTTQNDANYFLDVDPAGNPYIYGTSNSGTTPIVNAAFSNPGSGNYIVKFDPGFTAPIYATQFGDGTPMHLEPEAFMVDTCENVYVSGFNSSGGYPVTTNALYASPGACGGGSCYFFVLKKNATQQLYGSFYFGWHVDGGTSRFDPAGTIYQGICIGSGGATTPGWAYDNGANPSSWDMYVVKIAFQLSGTIASASAAPNDTICAGSTVNFSNTSVGLDFLWDFGDGSPTDTSMSPGHTYPTPGTYQVMLTATDSSSCIISDTTYLTITVLAAPVANLGPDTVLCNLPNLVLDAQNPGNTYTWSTGATSQTITVTTAGTYWVNIDNGVCQDADTIQVSITTPPGNFSDTALCAGQPLTLDADNPGATFTWSTGATTQTITVITSGQYWVNIVNGSCLVTDTIAVVYVPYPVVSLAADTALCPGNTITLDAGNPGDTYLWSTAEVTQIISVNSPGTYWVTVSNQLCSASDTSVVTSIPPIALADSMTLCDAVSLDLDAGVSNATSYLWSTGETTQVISVQEEGLYWVTVDADGCTITDTTYIDGNLGGGVLYIPNTFTPNANGLNEFFTGVGSDISYFHMMIFNRWGQLIFETKSLSPGWDGKYKGQLVQEDVYVWKIEYMTNCTGEVTKHRVGHVMIMR